MCLILVGQGYPRKLFNLEHFPIYGIAFISTVPPPGCVSGKCIAQKKI